MAKTSLKDWIAAHPAKKRGPPCWLCQNAAKVDKIVQEFWALDPEYPLTEITRYLRENINYPGASYTLARHVRSHRGRV